MRSDIKIGSISIPLADYARGWLRSFGFTGICEDRFEASHAGVHRLP